MVCPQPSAQIIHNHSTTCLLDYFEIWRLHNELHVLKVCNLITFYISLSLQSSWHHPKASLYPLEIPPHNPPPFWYPDNHQSAFRCYRLTCTVKNFTEMKYYILYFLAFTQLNYLFSSFVFWDRVACSLDWAQTHYVVDSWSCPWTSVLSSLPPNCWNDSCVLPHQVAYSVCVCWGGCTRTCSHSHTNMLFI